MKISIADSAKQNSLLQGFILVIVYLYLTSETTDAYTSIYASLADKRLFVVELIFQNRVWLKEP